MHPCHRQEQALPEVTNSRFRCGGCKKSFPMAEAATTNGLQRFCSAGCARPAYEREVTNTRAATQRLVRPVVTRSKTDGVTPVKHEPKPKKVRDDVPTAVREDVLARDQHQCIRCGDPQVQLHHVHYRSEGVDHSPHNLVSLCVDCHNPVIHANKRYWQPMCLAYIWLRDVEGRVLPLGQVEKLVARLGG